jgi:hypothetical protein
MKPDKKESPKAFVRLLLLIANNRGTRATQARTERLKLGKQRIRRSDVNTDRQMGSMKYYKVFICI